MAGGVTDGLVSIGTFARATGLGVKALRNYDAAGVLMPARVDPATGYRSYTADQVDTGQVVRILRRLGVPVAELGPLLALIAAGQDVSDRLAGRLRDQGAELAERGRLLDRLVDRLGGTTVPHPITLSTKHHRPALMTTVRITAGELVEATRAAMIRLHVEVGRNFMTLPRPAYLRYHGEMAEADTAVDVDVCLPFDPDQAQPGELPAGIVVLPAGEQQFATTVVTGQQTTYPAILDGYDAVARWIAGHGFAFDGPAYEIYLHWTGRPGDVRNRLEVGFPITV